jgi:hypothetical protein
MFWNYTVSYTEFFENLPTFMTNFAIGKYSVYANETAHIIRLIWFSSQKTIYENEIGFIKFRKTMF